MARPLSEIAGDIAAVEARKAQITADFADPATELHVLLEMREELEAVETQLLYLTREQLLATPPPPPPPAPEPEAEPEGAAPAASEAPAKDPAPTKTPPADAPAPSEASAETPAPATEEAPAEEPRSETIA